MPTQRGSPFRRRSCEWSALTRTRPGGWVVLIQRAEWLPEQGRFGNVARVLAPSSLQADGLSAPSVVAFGQQLFMVVRWEKGEDAQLLLDVKRSV